ncbi:DM13 domain-containing protein [Methylophaga sp. OBS4]|uniref:DM13 domain-containing protein n=1 Tax=Methylophaga sp. OBS4 TaxID=2991935 RepID=UPI002255F4E6|nr:DM13 domain-containing protein [Methylophaga sp. OBS4]MCX4186546.1 DM13 domain-containing protein [Methylophaga sp. OBS4]
MKKILLFLTTHAVTLLIGFAAGIYLLPILIAPPAPEESEVNAVASQAMFGGQFRRDLKGSDALHWGEGTVSVSREAVSLQGKLAPGPDYRLYFSPAFVETKADFLQIKAQMVQVGDVKTFENFIVKLPASVDPASYNTVIVWCESFNMFITAARYR